MTLIKELIINDDDINNVEEELSTVEGTLRERIEKRYKAKKIKDKGSLELVNFVCLVTGYMMIPGAFISSEKKRVCSFLDEREYLAVSISKSSIFPTVIRLVEENYRGNQYFIFPKYGTIKRCGKYFIFTVEDNNYVLFKEIDSQVSWSGEDIIEFSNESSMKIFNFSYSDKGEEYKDYRADRFEYFFNAESKKTWSNIQYILAHQNNNKEIFSFQNNKIEKFVYEGHEGKIVDIHKYKNQLYYVIERTGKVELYRINNLLQSFTEFLIRTGNTYFFRKNKKVMMLELDYKQETGYTELNYISSNGVGKKEFYKILNECFEIEYMKHILLENTTTHIRKVYSWVQSKNKYVLNKCDFLKIILEKHLKNKFLIIQEKSNRVLIQDLIGTKESFKNSSAKSIRVDNRNKNVVVLVYKEGWIPYIYYKDDPIKRAKKKEKKISLLTLMIYFEETVQKKVSFETGEYLGKVLGTQNSLIKLEKYDYSFNRSDNYGDSYTLELQYRRKRKNKAKFMEENKSYTIKVNVFIDNESKDVTFQIF